MNTDLSDDEIMQALALSAQAFKTRFGEADLVFALQDLIDTIEAKYELPETKFTG